MKKLVSILLLLLISCSHGLTQTNIPNGATSPGAPTQPVEIFPDDYPSGIKVNRVRSTVLRLPITDPADLNNLVINQSVTTTVYSDGFGRPIQTVIKGGSPNNKDIVAVSIYDSNGRQPVKLLNHPGNAGMGNFYRNAISSGVAYYNGNPNWLTPGDGQFAYSKTEYDDQTLSRSVYSYDPGVSKVGQLKGGSQHIWANTGNEQVRKWIFKSFDQAPSATSAWNGASLTVTETVNENGKHVRVYKDIEGKTILTKTEGNSSALGFDHTGWLCTYMVYDEYGRLRQVITPKAVEAIAGNGWSISNQIFNNLCYSYEYDYRGRIITKKLPGQASQNFVYDNSDRVVLVQDGNMSADNTWMFSKADGLGRTVVEGKFINSGSLSAEQLRAQLNATSAPSNQFLAFLWTKVTNNTYSTGSNIPDAEIYKLNYYDNYNAAPPGFGFDSSIGPTLAVSGYLSASLFQENAQGLPTVAYTRKMDGTGVTSQWENSVSYYDANGRLIQMQGTNFKGGHDTVTIRYNFSGMPVASLAALSNPDAGPDDIAHTRIWKKINYDTKGRPTSIYQKINDEPEWRRLSNVSYSDLGDKMLTKSLGGNAEMQRFKYRIWGSLESINRDYCDNLYGNTSFFGEIISYDYGFTKTDRVSPSGMRWRTKGNYTYEHAYGYKYDDAGRLASADFTQRNQSAPSPWVANFENYTVKNINYDANGNLKHMDQWGPGSTGPAKIDQLDYTYANGDLSNQLQGVTDAVTTDFGLGEFTEPSAGNNDYSYDQNGNAVRDANRDITSIAYNQLNKPYRISFSNGRKISFVYNAAGTLLQKEIHEPGQTDKVLTYLGPLEYNKGVLSSISHEEGRVRPVKVALSGGGAHWDFEYDYFIKDHLGNVRSVITEEVNENWWQEQEHIPSTDTNRMHPCITCLIRPQGPNDPYVLSGHTMGRRTYTVTNELNAAATEEAFFDNVAATRDNKPGSTASDDVKDTRLNAAEGKVIGPSIMLQVAAGDKVSISTSAFYEIDGENQDYNSYTTAEQLVGGLLGALSGSGAYQTITEGTVNAAAVGNGLNGCDFVTAMQDIKTQHNADLNKPKAFLNYLLLNEHMQVIADQSGFIQTTVPGSWNQLSVNEREVAQSGYLIVFLSNEGSMNAHFDNLSVNHYKGKLLEENHYYPYGLTLTKKAFAQAAPNDNLLSSNKLNRKEFTNGSGLNWYDMGARMYDPQIGRWHGADPLTEAAANWTPYRYAFSNPAVYTDASGLYEDDGHLGDPDWTFEERDPQDYSTWVSSNGDYNIQFGDWYYTPDLSNVFDAAGVSDEPYSEGSQNDGSNSAAETPWRNFDKSDLVAYYRQTNGREGTDLQLGTLFENLYESFLKSNPVNAMYGMRKNKVRSEGGDRNTVPDFKGNAIIVQYNSYGQETEPIIVRGAVSVEAKAKGGGLYLSSNVWQMRGHIDNLAREQAGNIVRYAAAYNFKPLMTLITTANVSFSPGIFMYAFSQGIAYKHLISQYRIMNGQWQFQFVPATITSKMVLDYIKQQ
jgi:RHS repeat-associated protein